MKPVGIIEPKEVELPTEKSVLERRSELERIKALRDQREKDRSAYEKNAKAVKDACKDVWDDWSAQRQRHDTYVRIAETFREYEQIAGSEALAVTFLRKVFSVSDINDAAEWIGIDAMRIDVVGDGN